MITYMAWDFGVENDKGKLDYDIPKEIRKAFNYFHSKFNLYPDVCQVSATLEEIPEVLDFDGHKVIIFKDRMITSKNLLLGLSDETIVLKR